MMDLGKRELALSRWRTKQKELYPCIQPMNILKDRVNGDHGACSGS